MLELLKQCSNYRKDALVIFPDIFDSPRERRSRVETRDKSATSSLEDIAKISERIGSEDILNAVMEVKTSFSAPVMAPNMSEEEFLIVKQDLMIKFKELTKIIVSEIIIFPDKIVNNIKLQLSNGIFHPELLESARSYMIFKLNEEDFSAFLQVVSRNTFSAVNAEPPQITINQLISGEFNEPYTYERNLYLI